MVKYLALAFLLAACTIGPLYTPTATSAFQTSTPSPTATETPDPTPTAECLTLDQGTILFANSTLTCGVSVASTGYPVPDKWPIIILERGVQLRVLAGVTENVRQVALCGYDDLYGWIPITVLTPYPNN